MSLDKIAEQINKQDLELILNVNKKAIEIQTEVSEQNESIISSLEKIKKNQDDSEKTLEKINKQAEDTNKELFKMQILFITGVLSLIIQIIQIFVKK